MYGGRTYLEILPNFFEPHSKLLNPTTELKMPSTHKREKPWDTDDIDKWKASSTKIQSPKTAIANQPQD
jgi:hypothetical protein